MNTEKLALIQALSTLLIKKSWKLATAESCTGGGLAFALTELSGSSAWFERGFVTYSNEAKIDMLGVAPALIATQGAVSEAVALAMAQGALKASNANLALSITGIAGPTGGRLEKPVGMVCFGLASHEKAAHAFTKFLTGDRASIREQAILSALTEIISFL